MRNFLNILLLLIVISCKQENSINEFQNKKYSNVRITNTQERIFRSSICNRDVSLQVYLPISYEKSDTILNKYPPLRKESKQSYPVLYLLDSDTYFGMATDIARLLYWENKTPGIIIVGVNYGLEDWWSSRARDYLPYSWPTKPSNREASEFLKMYEKELIPYIESNFRADTNHRILFGHSAGAMFVLYSLFSNPELFQCYIAADTWIKYLNQFYFDIEEKYANEKDDLNAKVYFIRSAGFESEKITDYERFIDILDKRNYTNLYFEKYIIEDEDHLSSVPISLTKSLQWYFSMENKFITKKND